MLFRENSNYAHQRMEQLHPLEILRFHVPVVLVTLSNLRGQNKWDSAVLGPFLNRLQNFHPDRVQRSDNARRPHCRVFQEWSNLAGQPGQRRQILESVHVQGDEPGRNRTIAN